MGVTATSAQATSTFTFTPNMKWSPARGPFILVPADYTLIPHKERTTHRFQKEGPHNPNDDEQVKTLIARILLATPQEHRLTAMTQILGMLPSILGDGFPAGVPVVAYDYVRCLTLLPFSVIHDSLEILSTLLSEPVLWYQYINDDEDFFAFMKDCTIRQKKTLRSSTSNPDKRDMYKKVFDSILVKKWRREELQKAVREHLSAAGYITTECATMCSLYIS